MRLELPTFIWWSFYRYSIFRMVEPIVIGKLIPE
jgi:hypothetical protein